MMRCQNFYNPSQNYIASANNKTVENFPYHISNLWEPPFPDRKNYRIVEIQTKKFG